MALSAPLQVHVDAVLAAVAAEMGGLSDAQFVRDRRQANIRDRLVQAVDTAVAARDFSNVTIPGAA